MDLKLRLLATASVAGLLCCLFAGCATVVHESELSSTAAPLSEQTPHASNTPPPAFTCPEDQGVVAFASTPSPEEVTKAERLACALHHGAEAPRPSSDTPPVQPGAGAKDLTAEAPTTPHPPIESQLGNEWSAPVVPGKDVNARTSSAKDDKPPPPSTGNAKGKVGHEGGSIGSVTFGEAVGTGSLGLRGSSSTRTDRSKQPRARVQSGGNAASSGPGIQSGFGLETAKIHGSATVSALPTVDAKVSVDEPAYVNKQVFVHFEWPNPDPPGTAHPDSEAIIPPFQPSEDMTASLSYGTANFGLASPQEVLLHFEAGKSTRAQWSLTPLKFGDSTVTVTLWYMTKDSSGNPVRQDYKAGQATVHVTVGPDRVQLAFEWLSEHWEFVAGIFAALVAALAWLRNRGKKGTRTVTTAERDESAPASPTGTPPAPKPQAAAPVQAPEPPAEVE